MIHALPMSVENGVKLVLALAAPVVAVLLCHWRLMTLSRARSDMDSDMETAPHHAVSRPAPPVPPVMPEPLESAPR